ncbi:hypothetical protein C8A00DRAFT_18033, partial [Chaetomidium leptoderma]
REEVLIKDSFGLPTLLVLGGLGQAILSVILPSRYALLPLVFLLLRAVILTTRDIASPARYTSKLGVVPGRTSAQLPNSSYDPLRSEKASLFGSKPAEKGVVVFNLAARFNHPLGALAPGGKELAERFLACHTDLLRRAEEYGCLGGANFRGGDAASNNTILTIYYFRDLDGLNRFAHDPIHRQAWDWYDKEFVKERGYSHIGISHEAFCAPAGAYETIYVNMQPIMMGACNADVKNEATGDDEWFRTLVDASSPVWRSQHSRMGREVKKQEAEKN